MRNRAVAVLIGMLVACGGSTAATTTSPSVDATTTVPAEPATTEESGFPVSIEAVNGIVTIESRPDSIVSLSATATEMLFALGAGDQVVAVDEQSNYPPQAPITDLSGFTPNLEAIVAYEPDLVMVSFDPQNLVADLEQLGIPVLLLPSALALDDAYTQIEQIGVATGNIAGAAELVSKIEFGLDGIIGEVGDLTAGVSFYHEIDATLYSASSASFVGQLYSLLGMENIADAADPDGLGFPQLSNEYIVDADPDVIFLADGLTLEDVSARPGWSGMSAVANGLVIPVDPDLSSRWGPRMLSFLAEVAKAIEALETTG